MFKNFVTNTKIVLQKEGKKSFFIKGFSLINRKLFLSLPHKIKYLYAKKIKNFKSTNIDEIIEYCFTVFGGIIRPLQIKSEFRSFLEVFKNKKPKIILEIGAASGGSLFSLCKLAPDDALIISIDLPAGEFGGGYPEWKAPIYNMFKQEQQELLLLREDSHLEETFKKITGILKKRKIDFLFIDGDHSYDGVKEDFEMYSHLVNSGGVIAFHDVAPNGLPQFTGGVPIFWKEIKGKYTNKEFIQDIKQTGYGIGCLFIK